ncbi:outer envelope protein 80, chloroplastic-like isoform X3 [Durio zibethinus]|uniref:Outer envelope protein 80, chloroplastic-like isoform X3 n=1 Tax=Durio zibethinus TaxID=66656 RepID=A0A6P5ZN70_DURZI|nr:outer envelope protein 80, chloroplastic-like isoform X3 [Durio zibethinus]
MRQNNGVSFTSSSLKIPLPSSNPSLSQTLASQLARTRHSAFQLIDSFRSRFNYVKGPPTRSTESTLSEFGIHSLIRSCPLLCSTSLSQTTQNHNIAKSPLLCAASLSLSPMGSTESTQAGLEVPQKGQSTTASRYDEERVLISEVLVRNKDGEELERKDLEMEALTALKACRANSALTVREVQEDVHRIIDSGYFSSCMPVAVDTRDGIRLVFQVEPNQEFHGLVCEGANVLPSKFLENAFRDGHDAGKVDLIMNVVERPSGGFSAGGGISSGITSGPLSGLIGSFAYSHRNLFGRNQKLNISLERGQIDSIFRINYTDPWIEGDDKRTSRTIIVQNSRTPGTLVHGNQHDNSSLSIGRVTAGVEFSRPIRPKWSGTAGLIFQHAGARDEKGNPIIKDFYGSPLTASGKPYDDMLLAKFESVYTGSGDQGSSMFAFNMEQGLPVMPEWLFFNRVNARARKGVEIGPTRLLLSLSGGHVVGNFSPHEAFAIGGTNSVRGYEEGAVGSGRSYVVGSSEVSFPLLGPLGGVIFADYGHDLWSGPNVPGDPAGARYKPGSGYGYGFGIRVDSPLGPLRLEYAFNDRQAKRFHFGVGHRS